MAAKNPKLVVHLDLLKSQSDTGNLLTQAVRWIRYSGRYIFIFVQAFVLIALIFRFKLDGDLEAVKKEIDQKKEYIQSLHSEELAIRATQFKLVSIGTFFTTYVQYSQILKNIADQTPPGVKFTSLTLEKQEDKIIIKVNAQALNSNDVSLFTQGLKSTENFSEVSLTTLNLEQNIIKFTINMSAPIKGES